MFGYKRAGGVGGRDEKERRKELLANKYGFNLANDLCRSVYMRTSRLKKILHKGQTALRDHPWKPELLLRLPSQSSQKQRDYKSACLGTNRFRAALPVSPKKIKIDKIRIALFWYRPQIRRF
jgi:hypothetical protein